MTLNPRVSHGRSHPSRFERCEPFLGGSTWLELINVLGVVAYPQNASAIRWLIAHGEELRLAFKENHRSPGDLVHSLALVVPPMTTEADFTPGADPDYVCVHVSIHEKPSHLEKTLEDFRRSLAQVGAPVADLRIVASSE